MLYFKLESDPKGVSEDVNRTQNDGNSAIIDHVQTIAPRLRDEDSMDVTNQPTVTFAVSNQSYVDKTEITANVQFYTERYQDKTTGDLAVNNNDANATIYTPFPEDYYEGTPETYPEYDHESKVKNIEPEPEAELPVAEPVPEWGIAKEKWGLAWEIHIYTVGCIFCVIAIYAFINILRLRNRRNLISKGYFMSLNIMLCIMGTTRAIYFLVDAYNSHGTFHATVAYMLYGLTFPCLSSAFSIQLLALIQTLRVRVMSYRIQKVSNLVVVIVIHFVISLVADVVVGFFTSAKVFMFICQVLFVVWGLSLCVAYFYVFRRLYKCARRRQKEMYQINLSHKSNATSKNPKRKPKLTMILALKVTFMSTLFGLVIVALQVYSMSSVFGVLSDGIPEAWHWWTYQLSTRIIEILMSLTMIYVASQPIRYNNRITESSENCPLLLYLVPCYRLCWPTRLEGEVDNEELRWLEYSHNTHDCNGTTSNMYKTFPVDNTSLRKDGNKKAVNSVITAGSLKTNTSSTLDSTRTHSMLVNEDGFIRFREEGDPIQDPMTSTDEELDKKNIAAYDNKKKREPFYRKFVPKRQYSADQCLDYSSDNNVCMQQQNPWMTAATHKKQQCKRSTSVPNTASNTPMGFLTPKSLCSGDFDGLSNFSFNFKPPSSIHLRDSIDKALNYIQFNKASTPESQQLSDSLSLPKTPDSMGSNNPCFKYEQQTVTGQERNCQQNLPVSTKGVTGVNHWQCSKTDLLRQNLADLRSRGGSSMSLDADLERSSLEPSDIDLTMAEISKRASLCRSNSDIILL